MKIVCDFCKTEYTLDKIPSSPVKCAVCGNVWTMSHPQHRNTLLIFFASLCALLAALVFAIVAITQYQATNNQKKDSLVVSVSGIETVVDEAGVSHFVVSGNVHNQSEEIYGMPNLLILSLDNNGKVVAQQKFMPPATLLDAGASAPFLHTLSAPTEGVEKITVKLENEGEAK